MFFFNPELLLIAEVDELNPANPAGWIWITNPIDIIVIFSTALIGMLAFSCFSQGYFITKANVIERFIFLSIVPFMFLPKIVESFLNLPTHYISYVIGIGIFAILYVLQKAKNKASKVSVHESEL